MSINSCAAAVMAHPQHYNLFLRWQEVCKEHAPTWHLRPDKRDRALVAFGALSTGFLHTLSTSSGRNIYFSEGRPNYLFDQDRIGLLELNNLVRLIDVINIDWIDDFQTFLLSQPRYHGAVWRKPMRSDYIQFHGLMQRRGYPADVDAAFPHAQTGTGKNFKDASAVINGLPDAIESYSEDRAEQARRFAQVRAEQEAKLTEQQLSRELSTLTESLVALSTHEEFGSW